MSTCTLAPLFVLLAQGTNNSNHHSSRSGIKSNSNNNNNGGSGSSNYCYSSNLVTTTNNNIAKYTAGITTADGLVDDVMAFTTVRYPMDNKEQLSSSYWPDNDEFVDVANENFFDQFVTFDGSDETTTTTTTTTAAAATGEGGGGGLGAEAGGLVVGGFGDEFLEDPPSPSLLLDSLDDSLTNSSSNNDQDLMPAGQSFTTTTATTSGATTINDDLGTTGNNNDNNDDSNSFLKINVPPHDHHHHQQHPHHQHHQSKQSSNGSSAPPPSVSVLDLEDPLIGITGSSTGAGGSIPDSELLRLEGISLHSPSGAATTTNNNNNNNHNNRCYNGNDATDPLSLSPPLIPTSSSSSATLLSPTKKGGGRFGESLYNNLRRAAMHTYQRSTKGGGRPPSSGTAPPIHVRKRDGRSGQQQQQHLQLDDFHPHPHHQARHSSAVAPNSTTHHTHPEPVDSNGLPLSPPLTGKIPSEAHHQQQHNHNMQFVTGHLDDPFCDDLLVSPGIISNHQQQQPSTPMHTPALKQEDMFFTPDETQTIDPNTTTLLRMPKKRNTSSAEWPMEGILTDDSSSSQQSHHLWSAGAYIPDSAPPHSPSGASWWEAPTSQTPSGATTVPSRQQQNPIMHADLPYEITPNHNQQLSGLMIHMPQPRQPQAAVLNINDPHQLLGMPPHHYPQQQQQYAPPDHHSRGHYSEHHHRRPQPRAPSSGARHHHGAPISSPRKPSLHRSSSRGNMQLIRDESVSPSPSRRRSSSMSVRKQRSWSSRQQQQQQQQQQHPRTTSSACMSPTTPTVSFGGGGGGGVDFVNFTPSDKNILMTGVAPSGSSKTKARREKEAMERRRRLSAAALKVVQEAGGDIEKLAREGFAF